MKPSWLFVENGLRALAGGLNIEIRLPWYRGLPLSIIEIVGARINGKSIGRNELTFSVNGKPRPAQDLEGLYLENWYLLDSAYLHVPYVWAKQGDEYDVGVTLVLHPPYIPGVPFQSSFDRRMRAN